MTIAIRPYQPNDEHAILDLFKASFGRTLSAEYWRWRFAENPVNPPEINLAWDGEILAAHYAVSPSELVIDGQIQKVALSMTTMTHPDYRGQDLFGRLAEDLYDRLAAEGYACVYGFPNRYSHRLFNRRLAWQDIGEVSTLTLLCDEARFKADDHVSLHPTASVPAWLEDTSPSDQGHIRLSRRAAVHSWRLKTPGVDYRLFEVRRKTEVIGFAAFKWYGDEALDLVDLCSTEANHDAVVTAIAGYAVAAGAKRVHTWATLWHPSRSALERVGFTSGGPVTMLGARWFQANPSLDPFDLRIWRFPMLASDVY